MRAARPTSRAPSSAGAPAESVEPHRLSIDELCARLASSRAGLDAAEARDRLAHEGPNTLPEAHSTPLALRLGRHLVHRFALLLWTGAALALVGQRFSPGEGMGLIAAALVVVVLLNAGFTFWQELRVERAMAAFRGMMARRARVLRGGVEVELDVSEIVLGDVLVLREGDRVAADARLFEASGLKVDNSPLTGESEPQLRTTQTMSGARLDARNLVFTGTLVTTGTGAALVYATGGHTEIGRIADVTHETKRVVSPIQRELGHFIRTISWIAVALGALFFVAGFAIGNPFWTNLVFAIGILVANVPEGLLPTVTLSLAIAGRKMSRRNALLKTLEAAETLGSTTVICTDKTGTLTCNEMRVTQVFVGATGPDGDGPSSDGTGDGSGDATRARAREVMALCNNAALSTSGDGERPRASGDPTETALLFHVEDLEPGGVARLRAQHRRVFERPFDSATKEMAVVCERGGVLRALLKGAPEVVLRECARVARGDDEAPLSADERARFLARADERARHGMRVLALAEKSVAAGDRSDSALEAAAMSGEYTLLGLVTMHDPPRDEVGPAVSVCRAAGIKVVVVSGDHPLTVEAVARQVGIVTSDAPAIHVGDALDGLSQPALRRALEADEVLFARTSPLHKLRVVETLQAMGHVVAVTGDGVNDAPALKRADVGIAMGKTGTDVAREAADVVLLDDNFASIVAAIEEGRVIYGNIQRFIGYVLTSNVPEILPYVAFVLLGLPLPLPVLLVLAIDLGTDMAPAVALATEEAETDVMSRPPRSPSARLLSPKLLLSSYLLYGLFEAAAGFLAYGWVLREGGYSMGAALSVHDPLYRQAIAAFFAAIVTCQLANVMVWRTTRESVFVKGLLQNRALLVGVAVELGLLALVVATPLGHSLFGTATPSLTAWLVPVPVALAMLAVAELAKARARGRARALAGTLTARSAP